MALAPCFSTPKTCLLKLVVLVALQVKQSRAEQPLPVIMETVAAMLAGGHSPFDVQLHEQSIVLTSSTQALTSWLVGEGAEALTNLVSSNHFKRLTVDLLFAEDLVVTQRCTEAYGAVAKYELTHVMNVGMVAHAMLQQRPNLAHLAFKYGNALGFKLDTVYDCLQLLDRVLCCGVSLLPALLPLLLVCCLLLAAHQAEPQSSWPSYEAIMAATGLSADAIVSMEQNLFVWLQQDTAVISPLRVVQLYLERLGYYLQDYKLTDKLTSTLNSMLLKVAYSPLLVGVSPSVVAAVCLYLLRTTHGLVPFWPASLAAMTGYNCHSHEFSQAVQHVQSAIAAQV